MEDLNQLSNKDFLDYLIKELEIQDKPKTIDRTIDLVNFYLEHGLDKEGIYLEILRIFASFEQKESEQFFAAQRANFITVILILAGLVLLLSVKLILG